MKTPNRFIDVNASTSKNAEKKSLSQRASAHNDAGEEGKVNQPKLSTNFSEKRGSRFSSSSHSNGHAEYSQLKLANRYRDLRSKYLMLKKENYSVKDKLKKSESEVKKLKKEKLALLDKLVVFEGLVESKGFVEHSDAESQFRQIE